MTESNEKNTFSLKQHMKQVEMPSLAAHMIFWPVVIAGVVADLWTKSAVFAWLSEKPYPYYQVIDGFFRLVMVENQGAAFGIAHGKQLMLVSVSVIAFFAVIGVFLFGNIKHKLMHLILAMFTAGIVGNFYDRAFMGGKVRDFLDVYVVYKGEHHWPAFNIADSLLCIAVGLMIILNIKASISEKHLQQQTDQP
jgi:signal peptidase II